MLVRTTIHLTCLSWTRQAVPVHAHVFWRRSLKEGGGIFSVVYFQNLSFYYLFLQNHLPCLTESNYLVRGKNHLQDPVKWV